MGFHGDNCVSQRYAPVTFQTFMVIDCNLLAYNVEYCAVTLEGWRRTPHAKIWRTRDGITGFCQLCQSHRNRTHVRWVGHVDVELHKKFDFLPTKDIITEYIFDSFYLVRKSVCLNCLTWLHCEQDYESEEGDEEEVLVEEEEEEEV